VDATFVSWEAGDGPSSRPHPRRSGVVWLAARPTAAQAPTGEEIDRAHRMLAQCPRRPLEYYYDSTFGGVISTPIPSRDSALDRAPSPGELFGPYATISLLIYTTRHGVSAPQRAANVDYGWAWTVLGGQVFRALGAQGQ